MRLEILKDIEKIRVQKKEHFSYTRIGQNVEGVIVFFDPVKNKKGMLIEVPKNYKSSLFLKDIDWRGMKFSIISKNIGPREEMNHMEILLGSEEHEDIFEIVCSDFMFALNNITSLEERAIKIENCITKWDQFFNRAGKKGLTESRQRGLFAELFWLKKLIDYNLEPSNVINAWTGCDKKHHDFNYYGHGIEVKSTIQKEHIRIMISNENQLDDRGLKSLHFCTLLLADSKDSDLYSLYKIVEEIKDMLSEKAIFDFKEKLVKAGYHEIDEQKYNEFFYVIKKELLYRVTDGFPRIIDLDTGLGDLKYSISLSSCHDYLEKDERIIIDRLRNANA